MSVTRQVTVWCDSVRPLAAVALAWRPSLWAFLIEAYDRDCDRWWYGDPA